MTHCLDTSTLISFLRQPNASHPLLEGARRVDLMIASIALVHDLTVVTINVKEFQLVPGLRIENWL